jgi:predicted Zn-dependent protease
MKPAHSSRSRVIAFLLILSTVSLFANVDPKKGRVTANPTSGNRYSLEHELDYGRQAVPGIEKEVPLLPVDHPVSKYINALGNRLAAKAPGFKFPYTFRVVNQKEINAFALPGGPSYVNTGTIAAASEAELAGVMGHEISHVVMRHSTRRASRQSKAAIPLAILSGVLGPASADGLDRERRWASRSVPARYLPSTRAMQKRKPIWSEHRLSTTQVSTRTTW